MLPDPSFFVAMGKDITSLNQDGLTLIIAYLDSADARTLCATARVFYAPAKAHTLREISLKSIRHARKACTHLLRNARPMLPLVRVLRVQFSEGPPTERGPPRCATEYARTAAASAIAKLLREVHRLEVLVLHEAELLLRRTPRVHAAVSALTRLKAIELVGVGPCVSEALGDLQSTPYKLKITQSRYQAEALGSRLRETLTLDPAKVCLRSVRVLCVTGYRDAVHIDELMRMFPSVVALDLTHWQRSGWFLEMQDAVGRMRPVMLSMHLNNEGYAQMVELFRPARNPRLQYIVVEYLGLCRIQTWKTELYKPWVSAICSVLKLEVLTAAASQDSVADSYQPEPRGVLSQITL